MAVIGMYMYISFHSISMYYTTYTRRKVFAAPIFLPEILENVLFSSVHLM